MKFILCQLILLTFFISSDLNWSQLPLTYEKNEINSELSFDIFMKLGYYYKVSWCSHLISNIFSPLHLNTSTLQLYFHSPDELPARAYGTKTVVHQNKDIKYVLQVIELTVIVASSYPIYCDSF